MSTTIDTADVIRHRPSDETWVVAYVSGDYLCCCGWPCSEAKLSDCELIEKASEAERLDLLRQMAAMRPDPPSYYDPRKSYAVEYFRQHNESTEGGGV